MNTDEQPASVHICDHKGSIAPSGRALFRVRDEFDPRSSHMGVCRFGLLSNPRQKKITWQGYLRKEKVSG